MPHDYYTQINQASTAGEAYRIFEAARQQPGLKLGGGFFHSVLCHLAKDNGNHVEAGRRVYSEMKNRGIALQTNNYNKLIFMCTKVGDFVQAEHFLNQLLAEEKKGILPNVETFNHFLSGYVNHRQDDNAFRLISLFQQKGIADEFTQKYYNLLIRNQIKDQDVALARKVYDLSMKGVLKPDVISFNQLIDSYANRGDVANAEKIFQEKPAHITPDRITFNSLIKAGVIARNAKHIFQTYQQMKQHGMDVDDNLHNHCWKIVSYQWDRPVEDQIKNRCHQLYATHKRIDDVAKFAFTNPRGYHQMQASRTEGSNTIANDVSAKKKWLETDEKVRALALKKLPLTPDFLCKMHQSLGGSGVYRTKGAEVAAGSLRAYLYCPGERVEEEMKRFFAWYNKSIAMCDSGRANPIEIAAEAAQRLVSIHPFSNENGRTSRLLMDYILQRYDLPPAALGKDIKLAIFAFAENGVSSSSAVESVLNGVKRSYSLLAA